jgi:outer membrane protein assembly factor BamB
MSERTTVLNLGLCATMLLVISQSGRPSTSGQDHKAVPCWPAFLGAGATPIKDPDSIPIRWSPKENIAWKAKLPGQGQSSPVIWGDKVYVTSLEGTIRDKCHVTALRLSDGSVVWDATIPSAMTAESSYYHSRAAPTPVVDDERIYAFFETGNLVALDHAGKKVWERDLVKEYGAFIAPFGLGASPAQWQDKIYVLVEHSGPSYLLAIDKATGKTAWKVDRPSRQSWSSPAIFVANGKAQVVISSNGSVDAYDCQTGKLLWSVKDVGGNVVPTPVCFAPEKMLIAATPGRGDKYLEEARRSNFCLEVTFRDSDWQPRVVWRVKALASFASPCVHQGVAYWTNSVGGLFAYDLATGEELYTTRLKQSCWATPMGIGDRVYFFGKDGLTTVLRAGRKLEVLAENQLWENQSPVAKVKDDHHAAQSKPAPGQGTPRKGPGGLDFPDPVQYGAAVVDGTLVIRTGAVVYCIRHTGAK